MRIVCNALKNDDKTVIEHWYPLSQNKHKAIDYKNLVASCYGLDEVEGKIYRHCDKQKSNDILKLDPQDETMMAQISYDSDGRIYFTEASHYSEEDIRRFQSDIDDILCLNLKDNHIKSNRQAVYTQCQKTMAKLEKQQKLSIATIAKIIRTLEEQETYEPYVGVMLFYYRRWLRRHQNQNRT